MAKTGESYATALRNVLAEDRAAGVEMNAFPEPAPGDGRAGPLSIEQLDEIMLRTPRDREVLVAAADPELGPYTQAIRVPVAEVEGRCRGGYRRISGYEVDAMIGDVEDFTGDWKHSE